ncbi:S41 family peptidase [Geofilum rubicundum]|uniref:Carboxyl-terminal protease n=1 Tax=Geofilum rubicundum JCM 15548 TaxID=1236989 RepID=A0A0E9LX71_9BACT|nr:S41 family peptidase [Geofilum rubicundum]GAO29883.1 carboxyl-terminal protease [Geofilum rubicundum JCM 15548]
MNLPIFKTSNWWLWMALFAVVPMTSCDDDEKIEPQEEKIEISAEVLKINKFIYDNMNALYYWNEEMPDLNYREETDSEEYFYKLLKDPDDRWSFITDDIDALENYFEGVFKSPGYSIQGYFVNENSSQVVFIVEYVYRNSPASEAGLRRGDLFYKINGKILTSENYQELLALDDKVITLGQMTQEGQITAIEPAISVQSKEDLVQHPILATSITETETATIGYLAYASFIASYDDELAQVFTDFKAAGVDELVLDLRYNGGGSVATAQKLASMIVPAAANQQIFIREKYNDFLSQYNFDLKFDVEANNLNLERVYVLTTSGTASASEMIIYGLAPYMDVFQIGDETHGKYYASITWSDNMEEPEKRTHNWAIQPIVIKSENVDNSINYLVGLAPDYELDDIRYNADLGDPEEHFLAVAIEHITTGSINAAALKSASSGFQNIKAIKGFKESRIPYMVPCLLKTLYCRKALAARLINCQKCRTLIASGIFFVKLKREPNDL